MQRKPREGQGRKSGSTPAKTNPDDTRSGRPNPETGTGGRTVEHEPGYGGEGGKPRNPDRTKTSEPL